MLRDISLVEHIYMACGYTDLRRGINGLAQLVQQQFSLDPFANSLFLFCSRRRDRIKALLWEDDGFVLHHPFWAVQGEDRISESPELCKTEGFLGSDRFCPPGPAADSAPSC